jgi:hypothetical protein
MSVLYEGTGFSLPPIAPQSLSSII